MSESDLAIKAQNSILEFLKERGMIKDYDPDKTKYNEIDKTISYSYTLNEPIKRISFSNIVGFNFSKKQITA